MNEQTNAIILKVLEPYQPAQVAVFGSYVRGTQNPHSDIDVLVSFKEPVTLFDIARILLHFQSQYELTIDLQEIESLNNSFLKAIAGDLYYLLKNVNRSA